MIGRLPNRSDKTPSKGEQKNCINAKTTANRALHFAASVISPPRKSRISLGKTGMIKPIAKMSSVTVTRMKIIAAGRAFIIRSTTLEAAVSAAKGKSRRRQSTACGIRFSEDDGKSDAGANIGPESFRDICQRVEDNAFHLNYFA